MKSTKTNNTSIPQPKRSASLPPTTLPDGIREMHEAITSRGMLEIAADETAAMLKRKEAIVARGAELIRKNHPDLVHLLK